MTIEEIRQKINEMQQMVSKIKSIGVKKLAEKEIEIINEYQIVQDIYETQLENELISRIEKMSNEELTAIFEKYHEKFIDEYSNIKFIKRDLAINRQRIFEYCKIPIDNNEELKEVVQIYNSKEETIPISTLMCDENYVKGLITAASYGVKYKDEKYSQNILNAFKNYENMISQVKQVYTRDNKVLTNEYILELANKAFAEVLNNPDDLKKIEKFFSGHIIKPTVENIFKYGNVQYCNNFYTATSTRNEGALSYNDIQTDAYLKKLASTNMFKKSGYSSIELYERNFSNAVNNYSAKVKQATQEIQELQARIESKTQSYLGNPNNIKHSIETKLCQYRRLDLNQIIENNRVSEKLGISSPEQIPQDINFSKIDDAMQQLKNNVTKLKNINSEIDKTTAYAKTIKPEFDAFRSKMTEASTKETKLREELKLLESEYEAVRTEKVGLFGKKKHEEKFDNIYQKCEAKKAEIEASSAEKTAFFQKMKNIESNLSISLKPAKEVDQISYDYNSNPYIRLESILYSTTGIDEEASKQKEFINCKNNYLNNYFFSQVIAQIEAFAQDHGINPDNLKSVCGISEQTQFNDIAQIEDKFEKLKATFDSIKNKGIVKGEAKKYLEQIVNSPVNSLQTADIDAEMGKAR